MSLTGLNIDLDDLRAVAVLSAHGHFGRAAEALHISQPALTKKIRQVETRIGGRLFDRHSRGVTATAAGAFLCERARQLLEHAAEAEEMTRRVLLGNSGVLRIGAGLTTMLSGLPEVLRTFRRRYPEVHLTVRDMSSSDQLAALRRREIDVGFARMPSEPGELTMEPVIDDELQIACNATLWPAGLSERRALLESPFLILSREASATFHDHVLTACLAAGFTPRVVQEANQLLTLLTLVQSGIGISLLPASAKALRIPQVRFLDMQLPEAVWTVGMAWNPDTVMDTPAQHFLPLVRQQFRRTARPQSRRPAIRAAKPGWG
ncbi:LysR family transcriptional regulator [Paludibaculum fermentans]|uniref:LysR family transcriptional regulator n=1 Tax=Paludibaculum fermentans TaxID=1473598 RepID=A0A7S7NRL0_PALFE|nr:LysR family transcriptional regulator [Paludibaculum fermentans]QOY88429.1 LysR family transcriptional regulator [Paludibaculum fermentans]